MPDDQLMVPEQKQRLPFREEIRRERLGPELETKEMRGTGSLQNAANRNPMLFDHIHELEIAKTLEEGIRAYCKGKPLEECSKPEKLEALLYALRDPEFFGLKYKPVSPIPKSIGETYTSKEGDCNDLSMIYAVLAQRLGEENLTQLYVNFKEVGRTTEYGHAALLVHEERVFYVDPAANRWESLPPEIKTVEQALKSKKLQTLLLDSRERLTGVKGNFVIDELAAVSGTQSMDFAYYFEKGIVATEQKDWSSALDNFLTAAKRGLDTRSLNSQIAQAYFFLNDYHNAVQFYKKAIKQKPNAEDYGDLGYTYSKMGRDAEAVEAFRLKFKLSNGELRATFELGTALHNLAVFQLNAGDTTLSKLNFNESEFLLKRFLRSNSTDEEARTSAMETLDKIKSLRNK